MKGIYSSIVLGCVMTVLAACASAPTPTPTAAPTIAPSATRAPATATSIPTATPIPSRTPSPSPEIVILARGTKIAQLTGDTDRGRQQPTQNQTESRFKLRGTDLGIPFRHKDRTYLLFGDSGGAHGGDAIAYTTDTTPEDGIELTFLQDRQGTWKAITIPGISQKPYEVPMAGTSVGGKMYVYHTTDYTEQTHAQRTVVAVSNDDGQTFSYLYDFSKGTFRFPSIVQVENAALNGLPQNSGRGLLIYGAGPYRQSDVRLAYQPADQIESRASIQYLIGLDRAGKPQWGAKEEDAKALTDNPCVGNFSVTYNQFLRKWLMLYDCRPPKRGINFRTADYPWGPWSEAQILFEAEDDNGLCNFIHMSWKQKKCDNLSDPGEEETMGGAYGPYQFDELAIGNDSQTTIYFTMSTWNPYVVVLMKATIGKRR